MGFTPAPSPAVGDRVTQSTMVVKWTPKTLLQVEFAGPKDTSRRALAGGYGMPISPL